MIRPIREGPVRCSFAFYIHTYTFFHTHNSFRFSRRFWKVTIVQGEKCPSGKVTKIVDNQSYRNGKRYTFYYAWKMYGDPKVTTHRT